MLSANGTLIHQMSPLAPLCMFPYFGSGNQYISWIHINDLVRVVEHCRVSSGTVKIYNVCTKHAVTHRAFIATIAKVKCKRFFIFPIPAFVVSSLLGEMSMLMLNGQNAIPRRLEKEHFKFKYPYLKEAIQSVC